MLEVTIRKEIVNIFNPVGDARPREGAEGWLSLLPSTIRGMQG